ncbi:carbohydrate-binding module family 48 protein [Zasmidium cellare ATCC 36951]|uniref:Carbohydrate-binding module family 48 protein n=1 Tax=Zasmidium cellare ATCC 36951 TaxID=1080233 RepID=A0A6A6CD29_ZASCE|nr:carbohydrate-binding module family 48 protein [Zasmidium cellare ATCC 36951]KAF2163832.1 carbohydrate-binding module family 48 protein [Zasmidium cellare ATCC 36951]
MGSYTFRWEHPAEEVYVTGTFDDWSKTVQLDKKDTIFEKTVNLKPTTEKILYKFVADGDWKHDHTGKIETDDKGNVNNVLYPDDIKPPLSMAQQTISGVAPGATTTELAGEQPLQKENAPPGAFPETPAVDSKESEETGGFAGAAAGAAAGVAAGASAVAASAAAALGLSKEKQPQEEQTFSVNPIPASEGAGNPVNLQPGEKVPHPSTINANTVSSSVHDDPSLKSSEQTLGVAPLPATGGIGNPVHLQPGEKVPDSSTLTTNTINSNVKLDQASYEKSDSGAPQLPPVLTPTSEAEAAGTTAMFGGLGPQTSSVIPESGGMGIGKNAPPPIESQDTGPAMSSVAPTSTTNQLAGLQPKEPRGIPEVVSESQQEAHVGPEAAGNPVAVQEKKEVESELKAKVPEENAGSENTGGITGAVAGGVAAAGAAVAGGVAVARQKAEEQTGKDPVSVLPESVQNSINNNTTTNGDAARETASAVPTEVKESQKDAHVDPEAAANPEAVNEKSQVEQELLNKVPESQEAGQPAPTIAAATSATAPAGAPTASGAPQLADPVGAGLAPISMDDKGLNASAATPATVPGQAPKVEDSRDVSPMSKPTTQTQPVVTTGAAESTAPTTSKPVGTPRDKNTSASTPQKRNSIIDRLKGTPESSKTTGSEGKKKGFFSKIKEKLKQYRRSKKTGSSCFGRHSDESGVVIVTESGDEVVGERHDGTLGVDDPKLCDESDDSITTVSVVADSPPRLSLDFADDDSARWDGKTEWPSLLNLVAVVST